MSEAGPLERVVQGVVVKLSEQPEEVRLAIRSRRGLVLDGMASVSDRSFDTRAVDRAPGRVLPTRPPDAR